MASSYTIVHPNLLLKQLHFEDVRDFNKSPKGLIASPPYTQIMAETGHMVWELDSDDVQLKGFDSAFDTIHPSL